MSHRPNAHRMIEALTSYPGICLGELTEKIFATDNAHNRRCVGVLREALRAKGWKIRVENKYHGGLKAAPPGHNQHWIEAKPPVPLTPEQLIAQGCRDAEGDIAGCFGNLWPVRDALSPDESRIVLDKITTLLTTAAATDPDLARILEGME